MGINSKTSVGLNVDWLREVAKNKLTEAEQKQLTAALTTARPETMQGSDIFIDALGLDGELIAKIAALKPLNSPEGPKRTPQVELIPPEVCQEVETAAGLLDTPKAAVHILSEADKVAWTGKLKTLLGMVSEEMKTLVHQKLISKEALSDRGISEKMKTLLHFSKPSPLLADRRQETRAMLMMLVASGFSVEEAASVKKGLYQEKNAKLLTWRGHLDALLTGGPGAPAAASAILSDKNAPLSKLLMMENTVILNKIVDALPKTGATIAALEWVEESLVQDPQEVDLNATTLTVEVHEAF